MSEIRIAWISKKLEGNYSTGNWHPMENYDSLKSWVVLENKKYPSLYHWLEEKNETGKILNYDDTHDGFTMIIK